MSIALANRVKLLEQALAALAARVAECEAKALPKKPGRPRKNG
jgi:hypothetical protein